MEFMDDETFNLNLAAIVKEPRFLSTTRLLATTLMDNPYLKVADFFQNLPDEELQLLLDISETLSDEEGDPRTEELLLMAEMLALGEGLEGPTMDVSLKRLQQFSIFIALESLQRKGLVKLHYEHMSFGEDYDDKVIAEKP